MAEAHPPDDTVPAPDPAGAHQTDSPPATDPPPATDRSPAADLPPAPEPIPEPLPEPVPELTVAQAVSLRKRPSYLKTADPMPMLRPPDLIGPQEVGQVVELRALGIVAVRFRRGTFLLAAADLTPA
jgi:hypothetical protein